MQQCFPAFKHSTAVGHATASATTKTDAQWQGGQASTPSRKWPGSRLAPEFQSNFADPGHLVSSGDFVALVTGGKHTTVEVSRDAMRSTAAASRKSIRRVKSTAEGAGLRISVAGAGDSDEAPRRIMSPRAKEELVDTRLRRDWVPKLPHTAVTKR
ncbi:hypothetical protein diail_2141 [Diaporthe ilicicola]|nr:hypothetical protein diail_2141 [Diaporthe ilicicola]